MRRNQFGLLLLIVAVGMVFAADHFNLPQLYPVLIMGVGLAASVAGVRIIIQGEAIEGRQALSDPRAVARFRGLSARLIGVVLVVGGGVIMVLGWLDLTSPAGAGSFLSDLMHLPAGWAIGLGLAGLMLAAFGLSRLLSGSGAAPGYHTRLAETEIRFGGAISAGLGVVLLLIAVGLIVAPDRLQGLFEQVVSFVKGWLPGQS